MTAPAPASSLGAWPDRGAEAVQPPWEALGTFLTPDYSGLRSGLLSRAKIADRVLGYAGLRRAHRIPAAHCFPG